MFACFADVVLDGLLAHWVATRPWRGLPAAFLAQLVINLFSYVAIVAVAYAVSYRALYEDDIRLWMFWLGLDYILKLPPPLPAPAPRIHARASAPSVEELPPGAMSLVEPVSRIDPSDRSHGSRSKPRGRDRSGCGAPRFNAFRPDRQLAHDGVVFRADSYAASARRATGPA